MATPPPSQQTTRSSTGALSQQSTLVPTQAKSEALKKALNSFRNKLEPAQLLSFKTATYDQLVLEILRIQREQGNSKNMMNLTRLQAFLEGMQQLGKTIEVFLNVSDAVAFVWGPVKFILLAASAYAETFDTLLNAYEQIGEQLPLLSDYESLHGDDTHMANALAWIYEDILMFHQRAVRFFQGSKARHIIRAMWKNYDTEFNGLIQKLGRHKDLVESCAALSQYRRYQEDMLDLKVKLDVQVRCHQEDMLKLNAKLDAQVEEEKFKKLIKVREWLAAGQQAIDDHADLQKIREKYPSTAKWILNNALVKDWMGVRIPTTPLLWAHGIPGAGKTVLASAIIEECKGNPDFKTGYFYCHDGDPNNNTAIAILKGIVDQLLQQEVEDLLPQFYTKRTSSGDATLRSFQVAKRLLEDCCEILPKLFIVVDGIDECDAIERREALEALTHVTGVYNDKDPGKLRVLIISQHSLDIHRVLHSGASLKVAPSVLALSEADVENDIRVYVRTWVDKIAARNTSEENPFNEDMKEYLRNLTMVNAKGMFLYAKLVLVNLYELNTRERVIDAIKSENFPRGLEEAYERIVRRIKQTSTPEDWEDAKKLFGWMVCAKRQLTWKEIQVALSIDTDSQTIEYDNRHLRKHINEICGSLVIMSGDRAALVHSTAKTYITKITKDIHEPTIECELAILCLQYLTFPCFEFDEQDDQQELRRLMLTGHFAFQDYAVAKWFHHVNAFVNNGRRFLDEAVAPDEHLRELATAIDDFMTRYDDEEWGSDIVQDCKTTCETFKPYSFHEALLCLTSHIYKFQQKGFDARHKISIKSLADALERNRKLLEELPDKLDMAEKKAYRKFYDENRRYKCTKITCRYFSQGFVDAKSKKRHVNIHDRPFQCDVSDCLGVEGFSNPKDLQNHIRSFHPEISDLAETFTSSTSKQAKSDHACVFCGKTFTRNFARKNHEKSHRGERDHECPECGKAFTRLNDCKRHQKLHERGR
ncbi:C2H2 domain-containing protein [Paraphoma chrysanthemicola]|uniref:C2H2 domain-containing protein n=1 Tax=Paraphoma chrysanthemicola TaxID=798071 RepID=A0A8K0R6V9_9PLEO|nr:C2H2 domain-containing protein [Paraphoma chrysanthemicola]